MLQLFTEKMLLRLTILKMWDLHLEITQNISLEQMDFYLELKEVFESAQMNLLKSYKV